MRSSSDAANPYEAAARTARAVKATTRVESGAAALDPAFHNFQSCLGRRGPSPATACSAHHHLNASS